MQQMQERFVVPAVPCDSRFIPDKGHKTCYAMTLRDFVMRCTALRENAQPFASGGLLGSWLAAIKQLQNRVEAD
jgi:hypothetical protein